MIVLGKKMGGTGFASVPRRRNSRKRVFRGLEALVALLTVLSLAPAAFSQDDDVIEDDAVDRPVMMPAQIIVRQPQFNPAQIDQWVFNRWGARMRRKLGWRQTSNCGSTTYAVPVR